MKLKKFFQKEERNKEFQYQKCETEKKNFLERYNRQKQNYKQNKDHNYDAGVLFRHLDHCNRDDIVFLKAVLRYAHNCAQTETISKTIL